MKNNSEKLPTTERRCNTLPVAIQCFRIVNRPKRENAIIIAEDGIIRDIRHDKAIGQIDYTRMRKLTVQQIFQLAQNRQPTAAAIVQKPAD